MTGRLTANRVPLRVATTRISAGVSLLTAVVAASGAAAIFEGPAITSSTTAPTAGAPRWLPPVQPLTVMAPFDPPPQDWLPGHRGVDVAARPSDLVLAPAPGTVAFSGVVADRPVVVIDHGGIRSTYEPVTGTVAPGEPVQPGEVIGEVGVGGHCGSSCVHWGALIGDSYIDPLLMVRGYVPVLKTPW